MGKQTIEERFWSKVDRRGPDECWLWLAAKTKKYGAFRINGRNLLSHRFSWELHYGEIPENLVVRHVVCNNPACVNPGHLALGTQADNIQDAVTAGRNRWVSKLTDKEVQEIKQLLENKVPRSELAKQYGVCVTTIRKIAIGKRKVR